MNAVLANHLAEKQGHRLGKLRDGRAYCTNGDCSAMLVVNGKLPELEVNGSAIRMVCPYRKDLPNS